MIALALLGGSGCGIKFNNSLEDLEKALTVGPPPGDTAPVTSNITPVAFNEDVQSTITLAYTDVDGDFATNCSLSNLMNVSVTTPCVCLAGVCTVGVTGISNYNGPASFDYVVIANSNTSNTSSATLTINAIDDAPIAANITPAAFDEDLASGVITLSYTDAESHLATVCSISGLSNVTVTTACACAAGVCTVGVTGLANYNGAASFNYTVTANGQVSNTATASLTINSINDAPVISNVTNQSTNEDTATSAIAFTITDVDSALNCATSMSTSSSSNTTLVPNVNMVFGGTAPNCTVTLTPAANQNGTSTITLTVSDGSLTANDTFVLTVNAIDDAPVAANLTPGTLNYNVQHIITLSYTDAESHLATVCSTSALSNLTVTQACACAAGVCTVGVTSALNYTGAAGFNYTVTANGLVSNTATTSITFADLVAPTVALTASGTNPIIGPITVTATFSEPVTGVASGDFTLTNATAGTFTAVSSTVYTLVVTPTAQGAFSIDMAAGVAQDLASNNNTAATTLNRTFDKSCTVAFTTTGTNFTGNSTVSSGGVQWNLGGSIYATTSVSHNWGSAATRSNTFTVTDGTLLSYVSLSNAYYNPSNNVSAVTFTKGCYWLQNLDLTKNLLTTIDISNLKNLRQIAIGMNSLTTINTSQNTLMTHFYGYFNNFNSLNFTTNTALQILDLGWGGSQSPNGNSAITSLDLSQNTALTKIDFTGLAGITSLNLTANTALVTAYLDGIWVGTKNNLSNLNVTGLTNLKTLSVNNASLATIDVSTNTALETLNVGFNYLTSINVTNNTALKNLYVYLNNLTALDVSNNDALVQLWACWNNWGSDTNNISFIDFSQKTALTQLVANCRSLTSADLSDSPLLTFVNLNENQLTSVDFTGLTTLFNLYLGGNNLDDSDWASMDMSNKTMLGTLTVDQNEFTNLDLTPLTSLGLFSAMNMSNLTTINVSGLASLTSLYLHNSSLLNSLTLSGNTALANIMASGNSLSAINFAAAPNLVYVDLTSSQMTSINLSSHPLLETLFAYNTSTLTSVNLNGATSLRNLQLQNNAALTALNLSTNTALQYVICYECDSLSSLTLGTHASLLELDFRWTTAATRGATITEAHAKRAGINTAVQFKLGGAGTPTAPELANISVLQGAPHNWVVTHD